MTTTLRTGLSLLLVALFALEPSGASAQTDSERRQMEYERQQREYWRAQEQRRQEEQRLRQIEQETVRRREEQAQRERRQYQPQSDSPSKRLPEDSTARRSGETARSSGGGSAVEICKVKPLRSGERNPLLGKWRPRDTPQGDGLTQLMQSLAAPGCMLYGLGIEFREREIKTVIAPSPAQYGRNNEDWWVCVPGSEVEVMRFRVEGPNQLFDPDRKCRLIRVGAAATDTAAAAPAGALSAATSQTSVGTAAAVSLAAGVAAPGGAFSPVAGRSFFVLRNSVDVVMASAGIEPEPGVSRLKTWALACERGSPACRQGANALLAASAAVTKTDAAGNGRMAPLPAGAYYVFGVAPNNTPPLLWNVKVDLKPGENAVRLDHRNATLLD